MNILFIADTQISAIAGGMERLIHNLATELMKRGVNCYGAYYDENKVGEASNFTGFLKLNPSEQHQQLQLFIRENNIQFIITALAQKRHFVPLLPQLHEICLDNNCKLIYGYYNMPGYELEGGISTRLALWRLFHGVDKSYTIRQWLISQAHKLHLTSFLRKRIGAKLAVGADSDLVYVLSPYYVDSYKALIPNDITTPFVAISNPLSYPENISIEALDSKEKIVLNVSRFDDGHKKQSALLYLWKQIEQYDDIKDWKLVLVGYGPDELYLKKLAQKLKLERVEFVGACDPRALYTKASIYAKTSAYEGLPMVLLDVQQYGVVPISVDSFAAVHDIIEDGKNGYIIPYNDPKMFAAKMHQLMVNDTKRKEMAIQGLQHCEKFKTETIVDQWMHLFEQYKS